MAANGGQPGWGYIVREVSCGKRLVELLEYDCEAAV